MRNRSHAVAVGTRKRRACRVALCLLGLLARPAYAANCTGATTQCAQYFYDAAGQLSAVVDPVNGTAVYNYDAAGNLTQVLRYAAGAAVIANAVPSSGSVGTSVTINGVGFGNASNTTVTFNGVAASPTSVTNTQIIVPVPSGATSGNIVVTSPTGASNPFSFSVIQPTPSITSIPTTPVTQGSTITINGANFATIATNNRVLINGRYATVTAASSTALMVTVPIVGSGPVQVETPAGSALTSGNLIVNPQPAYTIGATNQGSIGNTSTIAIGSSGQIGLIFFNATAGQRINPHITADSFGIDGTDMLLYGPDGNLINSENHGLFSNGNYLGTRNLILSGLYTLAIVPYQNATGSISVNLLSVPPDPTASVTINGPAAQLTTNTVGQNMVVYFSGSAGQRINLTATNTGPQGGCGTFEIQYPNNGAYLWTLPFCGLGQYSSGAVTLPVTGPYEVQLSTVGLNTEWYLGSTSFQISTALSAQVHVASQPFAAVSAAKIQTIAIRTTDRQPTAHTHFRGAAGAGATVSVHAANRTPDGGDFYVTIREPDGHTILRGDESRGPDYASGVLRLPKSGIYTIDVTAADAALGTYQIEVHTP
jgi:YD repeat-containing protein